MSVYSIFTMYGLNIAPSKAIRNRFRQNFHILDRCTKFGGNYCDFDGGFVGGRIAAALRPLQNGTGRTHTGGQSRPPLLPVIPSQSADWRGNPSPQKRKTDCRVATLLAMTARRCRADGTTGTPSPTTNNAAPRMGCRAFSVYVVTQHRRRRVIFAAWLEREPRGKC